MNDEAVRRMMRIYQEAGGAAAGPRRSVELEKTEALRLLSSVSFGRIVFTLRALPAIRPVNHVMDDGDIIIRTHEGAALVSHTEQGGTEGVVVAYEADAIDPVTDLGWSVVATGYAHLVTDPVRLAHYQEILHGRSPPMLGDRALDVVLSAYAEAQRRYPRPDPRHRIEHCAVASPKQVERVATGLDQVAAVHADLVLAQVQARDGQRRVQLGDLELPPITWYRDLVTR